MKKRFFFLMWAFCCIFAMNAQIFWKISGNNLTKPSYLLGTHHLIDQDSISGFKNMLACVNQVDAVITEIDMTDMLALQTRIARKALMTDKNMKDLLSEEDYKMVDEEFKSLMGVGLGQLGQLKPMMLDNIFTVLLYQQAHKIKKEPEAVDLIVQRQGKESGKELVFMETADEQIDILFNKIPYERQAEILVKEVREKENTLKLLEELNVAYLSGDLYKIDTLMDPEMTDEEKAIFVDSRNEKWMEKLLGILPVKSCFIAVGCGHLTGDSGLIVNLRKAGYLVEKAF